MKKHGGNKRWFEAGMSPVELLISVCTIGALLLLVTILIDRTFALQRTRDLLRTNHVQRLLSAVLQYQVDHAGALPADILRLQQGKAQMIALPGSVCTNVCPNHPVLDECIELSKLVPKYMRDIPQDPFFTEFGPSGYYIYKHDADVITVGACITEATTFLETR